MARQPSASRDRDPIRLDRQLVDERSRVVLDRLAEHRSLTLADLADELAAHEHDRPITAIPGPAVTDVYLDLYRSTIPRLRVLDLVRYDQALDLVAITETGQSFVSWRRTHDTESA